MKFRSMLVALSLLLASVFAMAQDKVVYHIADTATQALAGLRSAKNQLDTEPNTQITFVAHADGVDFLLLDAKDRNGNPYEVAVQELARRGVKFEVCEITLKSRGLKKEQFLEETAFTPSGVVRITKLQRQGYAYLRP